MDSCHIFNFLFGTRKTTSELSKHFRASVNEANAKDNRQTPEKVEKKVDSNQGQETSQPASPLKQIQTKIANLASSVKKSPVHPSAHECDTTSCGTYRATLVEFDELPVKAEADLSEVVYDANNNIIDYGHLTNQINNTTIQNTSHQHDNEIVCPAKPNKSSFLQDEFSRYKQTMSKSAGNDLDHSKSIMAQQTTNEPENTRKRSHDSAVNQPISQSHVHDDGGLFRKSSNDKKLTKSEHVRHLVESFELSADAQISNLNNEISDTTTPRTPIKIRWPPEQQNQPAKVEKPTTIVKPLPPKTPPKTKKVICVNYQMKLCRPTTMEQLFQDTNFLTKFFSKLEPIDRCTAAQVCRLWRTVLYSNHAYWQDLVSVIDCTSLRREHLLECIVNTLQTAKLRHLALSNTMTSSEQLPTSFNNNKQYSRNDNLIYDGSPLLFLQKDCHLVADDLNQEEVWRIQELCQKFTRGSASYSSRCLNHDQQQTSVIGGSNQVQQDNQQAITSKSSSIPSQISSTISSASISSLLSPLSESSRVDSIKERIYTALDDRGFDAICLYGASDEDIEDLVSKTPYRTHKRILVAKLDNCSITDKGFKVFIKTFHQIRELQLSGCNEITNSIDIPSMDHIERLVITDCINIADGFASKLIRVIFQLKELTIQSYHITDAFLEYVGKNSDTSTLKHLYLTNCREIANHSMYTMSKYFQGIETLSISGSSKIGDEGIEMLLEEARNIQSLDLSWCPRMTDSALETIACDLAGCLRELILDRNPNISDYGVSCLPQMPHLSVLSLRWCPKIGDRSMESILSICNLRKLSLAGLEIHPQYLVTLIENDLFEEVDLVNCPYVTDDLLKFLSKTLPDCTFIY